MENEPHRVVNKVGNFDQYMKAVYEDKYNLLVLHKYNSTFGSSFPAILLLARHFPEVSFCLADANSPGMKFPGFSVQWDDFKEPQFELFFQHQSIRTVRKPPGGELQAFVDFLSEVISHESGRFKKELLKYDRGDIDASNCYDAKKEEEEEEEVKNFYTMEDFKKSEEVGPDDPFITFTYPTSFMFSNSFPKVVRNLAEAYSECVFVCEEKNEEKFKDAESHDRLNISIHINKRTLVQRQFFSSLHGIASMLKYEHSGKFDSCNFVFTSCIKEAMTLMLKKPAVMAFVYDKDDEENIYSENAFFNTVHDFSFFYRHITVLLLEKAVTDVDKFPQAYHYAGRLKVFCFKKGEPQPVRYIRSLDQIVRGIFSFERTEIPNPRQLKASLDLLKFYC